MRVSNGRSKTCLNHIFSDSPPPKSCLYHGPVEFNQIMVSFAQKCSLDLLVTFFLTSALGQFSLSQLTSTTDHCPNLPP